MNMTTLVDGNEDKSASDLTDPVFLQQLRLQMIKFATLQLRNEAQAEDAVQEALLGALKNISAFGRRSALKTWVFAILKNKIADILRQNQRYVDASELLRESGEEDDLDVLFNSRGFWKVDEHPIAWEHPVEAAKNAQFWRIFETCLSGLPENLARIFMMREFLEFESIEICKTLDISTSNLHVMLYRARLRLRECLENRWFQEDTKND